MLSHVFRRNQRGARSKGFCGASVGLQTKTGNDFISCTSNWAFLSMMLICETRQSVEGLCGVCLWPEAHLEERHETLSACDHLALVWLLIVGARRQRLSPSPASLNGNSTCRGQHGAGRPAPCCQATSPQGLRNSGEKPHHFCPSSIQCMPRSASQGCPKGPGLHQDVAPLQSADRARPSDGAVLCPRLLESP